MPLSNWLASGLKKRLMNAVFTRAAKASYSPASEGLPAMLAFLTAQQATFAPAEAEIVTSASGQKVVTVRYDAPGPMDIGGS